MLLTDEWIENSIETYIYQNTTKSQVIYWVVLLAVTATLISLPFIYVDISIQSNGIIRPISEKAEIKSPVTEFVDSVYIHENMQVNKGDTILSFRTSNLDYKISYLYKRLNDYQAHIADLTCLTEKKRPPIFRSSVRSQEYIYFTQKKNELKTSLLYSEKEFNRTKILFQKKVIAEEEFDKFYFQYQEKENKIISLEQKQLSSWEADFNSYQNSYNETDATLQQEIKNRDTYIICSPINGTVEQFSGIYKGSNIQAGQILAVISPNAALYLEVYVTPQNIGFININMPINAQITSFNYTEWGTLPGKVKEISSDFLTDNQGNHFYKIKCEIERDYLKSKRGKIGKLKKGMTVNTHFLITQRSLFDLLYQNMNDWMNPKQYKGRQ